MSKVEGALGPTSNKKGVHAEIDHPYHPKPFISGRNHPNPLSHGIRGLNFEFGIVFMG